MIQILILIGAYRYYATLAEKFGKVKWHFGLLAIGVYFGTQLLFGFGYGLYLAFTDPAALDDTNYTGFSLPNIIGWLLSAGAVYGIYQFLFRKFTREKVQMPALEIEKIGKLED